MMPEKKILFLVSSMGAGGAERVAANLANAWVERGYKVTLLVTYSGGGECCYDLSKGVELRYLADEVGSRRRNFWTYFKRFKVLRNYIRGHNHGLVVSFLTNVNVAALLAGLSCRTRIIVSERAYPPHMPINPLLKWMREWTYRFAAAVVMQTDTGLDWAHRHLKGVRATVIPNPILFPLSANEPRLETGTGLAPGRKLLLAVGRLSEEKGFDRLLEAFSMIAAANPLWDLVILGEGPRRSALEEQVRVLGLEERASLPGHAGNVGDWYEHADLYVMSSLFEGFPNALGEAMAHGCAVVSYDCDTGPRDLIRHEKDGLLVTPVGDVHALAEALGRLMNDDELRGRMAKNAIDVRERYSMERILAMWEKLFDEVTHPARSLNLN